ncbi:restriction endonuclease subunit S [Geodermatophilus sp. SYSU D01105]
MTTAIWPAEWRVRPLQELLRRSPSYGVNAAASPYVPTRPTYIRITDISDDGRFMPSPRVSVDHPAAPQYLLQEGDLVFARTGASVGKSYRYRTEDGILVYAGFLIRITPDPAELNPEFLSYYVQTQAYWNWIKVMSVRSGQPGVNGQEYAQMPVPVPPRPEQDAIVRALREADDLVYSLERLIAKKQQVKKGIVQHLLAGRTRLPGFSNEWSPVTVGSLGRFLKGRGIKRDDVRPSGVACIRYGELYTRYGSYIEAPASYVDAAVAATAQPLQRGDLLYAASGETSEDIGICSALIASMPTVAGGDIIIQRGHGQDPVFLASLMNSASVIEEKSRLGQGDAVVHISAAALGSIEVRLPELPEQQAIARVITDAHTEIDLLTARLAKTKQIKRGMMQELLSGRTRLAVGKEAA